MTGMENISAHNLPVYLSNYLKNNHGIILCFTTRNSGPGSDGVNSFNLDYYAGGNEENVRKNREMILKKLELKKMRKIYSVKQVHGTNILNIDKNMNLESDKIMKEADCLITDLKDIPMVLLLGWVKTTSEITGPCVSGGATIKARYTFCWPSTASAIRVAPVRRASSTAFSKARFEPSEPSIAARMRSNGTSPSPPPRRAGRSVARSPSGRRRRGTTARSLTSTS